MTRSRCLTSLAGAAAISLTAPALAACGSGGTGGGNSTVGVSTTGVGVTAYGAGWYALGPAGKQVTESSASDGDGASNYGGGSGYCPNRRVPERRADARDRP